MSIQPILWSFRRCPYAMRARLALQVSGQKVELREILLRDKPAAFLETSPSGTVPCLSSGGQVIDESYDIMRWALDQSDPEDWLNMPKAGDILIKEADGPFKSALDRYKYHVRHAEGTRETAQTEGAEFLNKLDEMLDGRMWLFDRKSLADMAILPFVRQFANTDRVWFDSQNWPNLQGWLLRFTTSEEFSSIMRKYDPWQPDADRITFPQS